MTGHAVAAIETARQPRVTKQDTSVRRDALIEIMLARALFRCGDKDGAGRKILEQYQDDLRGHFARHAAAVLRSAR